MYAWYRTEYLFSATVFARTEQSVSEYAREIPVLLYHGALSATDGANVSRRIFAEQMFTLKRAGYETVTLAEFDAFLDGRIELPDRSILLTFDDGRKDSFYPVDPVLHALDYKGVEFVITGHSLGKGNEKIPYYLSKGELSMMVKTGRWELASHSRNAHGVHQVGSNGEEGHNLSNARWIENEHRLETVKEYMARIDDDLRGAQADLKESLGVETTAFAFPFGDFGEESKNMPNAEKILRDITGKIYKRGFYQTWGGDGESHNRPGKNILMVRRINVSPDWTGEDLVSVVEAGHTKNLPYEGTFTNVYDWRRLWGDTVVDNGLAFEGSSDSGNAAVFLNGSSLWKDYRIDASVNVLKGVTFSVFARLKDNNNFVTCNFKDGRIQIEERVSGDGRVLGTKTAISVKQGMHNFGLRVRHNAIVCTLDGHDVFDTDNVSKHLSLGGVGFGAGGLQKGKDSVLVKSVHITALSK